jgi:hypothetical protein
LQKGRRILAASSERENGTKSLKLEVLSHLQKEILTSASSFAHPPPHPPLLSRQLLSRLTGITGITLKNAVKNSIILTII